MQGPWTDFMFHTSYRTGYHVPYLTCNTGRLVCQAISESASVTMAAPMITPSHPIPTHTRLFMTHLHLVAHIWGICTQNVFSASLIILSHFANNRHFLLKDVHFPIDGTQSEQHWLLCGNIVASTWQRQQYLISCRHDFYFTSQSTQRGKLVRGSLVEEF